MGTEFEAADDETLGEAVEAEYARLAADPEAWAQYRREMAEWEARAPVAGRPRPRGGLYASGDPGLSQRADDALSGFGSD